MKLYKIVFAEFEKLEDDTDYSFPSFGTTQRIYKTEEECILGMFDEYLHLKRSYQRVEEIYSATYEFKVKVFYPNNRKEVLMHYKMIEFNT